MTVYDLNVEELARFLRGRKSKDCKIAADWVTDNPEEKRVSRAVDALMNRLMEAENSPQVRHAALFHSARTLCTLSPQQINRARMEACLVMFSPRFPSPENVAAQDERYREGWEGIYASAFLYIDRRLPAWASAVMKILRPKERKKRVPKPGTYVVKFLVEKTVVVKADNDLQAEIEAARKVGLRHLHLIKSISVPQRDGEEYNTFDQEWYRSQLEDE